MITSLRYISYFLLSFREVSYDKFHFVCFSYLYQDKSPIQSQSARHPVYYCSPLCTCDLRATAQCPLAFPSSVVVVIRAIPHTLEWGEGG